MVESDKTDLGNFVRDYGIITSDVEIHFFIEIIGYSDIIKVEELKSPSRSTMSRKAWFDHKNRPNNFATVEEYVKVLDDPSRIYVQDEILTRYRVHFLKRVSGNKIAVVVVYTDRYKSHQIATGYYIKNSDLDQYDNYSLIWTSK